MDAIVAGSVWRRDSIGLSFRVAGVARDERTGIDQVIAHLDGNAFLWSMPLSRWLQVHTLLRPAADADGAEPGLADRLTGVWHNVAGSLRRVRAHATVRDADSHDELIVHSVESWPGHFGPLLVTPAERFAELHELVVEAMPEAA